MAETVDVAVTALVDGSWLVVRDAPLPAADGAAAQPVEGTLTGEFVWAFGEAVAAGVTYETLRGVVVEVVKKTGVERKKASADDVCDIVASFLERLGHVEITIGEVGHLDGHGWADPRFCGR